jgi:hypothetical protein
MSYRKILALGIIGLLTGQVQAQDEGAVVKKERIERDKGIFIGGGVSLAGGSNLGDYSTGINFEGGFNKRVNRVLSIGGSISYVKFAYDPEVLNTKPDPSGQDLPSNFYYDTSLPLSSVSEGYFLTLKGGDLSIISLAANIKLNFVPVKDNSVVSVYAFAKPFIASSTVSSISGTAEYIFYDGTDWLYDESGDVSGTYDSKSSITGGIFLGPGLEINPAKPISIFVQASFGYTFPMEVVSTRSYGNDINDLASTNFPLATLGFTSINFAAGISFNID